MKMLASLRNLSTSTHFKTVGDKYGFDCNQTDTYILYKPTLIRDNVRMDWKTYF